MAMHDVVFVFGSNLEGRHGKGAALCAKRDYGASQGVGFGRTGMAYAIPTKRTPYETLPLGHIEHYVDRFLEYAEAHPELNFVVTAIGCGLAGYTPDQIAPFFRYAPQNCELPQSFLDVFERLYK